MQKLTAQDPQTKSADPVAENIQYLKEVFPEAFVEGKVDFEILKQLLGTTVDEKEEKYGLNWHGKRKAREIALTPSNGTLRPCLEDSVDWDATKNLVIEGDNLEVLKLLQRSYAGKVKLIYLDPPYNTGKDFVYPDVFQDSIRNYLELTGQSDGGGQPLTSNTETSGRFHTDWLNMMYPRLKLAWSLLRTDGVMFISIDDKELHHLRAISNELFGEESFVADVSVATNMKGRNDKKHIASCHEHILIYAKQRFVSFGLPLTEEQRAAFKNKDEKGNQYALRDLRKRGGPDRREDRPKMFFPIFWNRKTGVCSLERIGVDDVEILPMRGDGAEGCWRWGKEKVGTFLPWLHAKESERSGRFDVDHRVYLDPTITLGGSDPEPDADELDDEDEAIERTAKPKSIWLGGELSSDSGKRALKEFLPGDTFDFPKSIMLLRQCLQVGMGKEGIALDLFAGSGTLGQAIMAQNAEDRGARRFILVQLPEPLDVNNKDQRAAAKFCQEQSKPLTIAELTKERLRRAGKRIGDENPLFRSDLGFRVFKLSSSNIQAWEPDRRNLPQTLEESVDHLKTDRTEQDILFELLLKLGLDLIVPIETQTIAGHTVRSIGGGTLLVCLSPKIGREDAEPLALGIFKWHKQLATAGEAQVVFRDNAFADDVTKTNLTAILQQHGLENVRSL